MGVDVNMTCKQLVAELHEYIWMIFWLSLSVHVFLGVFILLMRDFFAMLKLSFRRNFQDHEDIGSMINRRNEPGE